MADIPLVTTRPKRGTVWFLLNILFLGTSLGNAGEVLRVRMPGDPGSLDWGRAHTLLHGYVLTSMIDTLVEIRDGDVVPALAVSVEVTPDQKKWTYRLRKNVKWSDGVAFEAKHVVDAWVRQLRPYFQGRYDSLLLEVENANEFKSGKLTNQAKLGIRALDAHTVEVKLKRPIPFWKYIPSLWAMAPIRMELLEKYGPAWTEPGKMAVLGAFQLESQDVGKKIRVVPNPRYWRSRGKVSAIEFVIVADENEAKSRFYEKSTSPKGLDLLIDVAGVDSGRPKVGSVLSSINERTAFLAIGNKKEVLRDAAFRRALGQSIEVSALADKLGIGVRPAFSICLPEILPGGISQTLGFDPEAAKLAAAPKWKSAGLVLEAMALDGAKPRATMQYIEAQWLALMGVTVKTFYLEAKDFYRAMSLGKYDVVLTGWMPDFPDPETSFAYFSSENAPNPALWSDRYYDEVVASARIEADPVSRISKYRSAERYLLTEEVTAIPLYNEAKVLWKRDGISGVAYTESGGLDLRNASVLKGF